MVDTYNDRIQKFDSSGGFVTAWGSSGSANGSFSYPSGVCSDPSGFIYVADTGNNRIEKFDSSGGFVTAWGSYGSANGSFSYPFGVCSDPYGFIYVADTYNDRVQKFDSSGGFVTAWGSSGSANGSFDTPSGVCSDPSGFIYVADTFNNRVQKFSSSGGFVTTWGSYGSANGSFYLPFGVCADPSGFIYVADTYNDRIQKFSSSGGFVTAWGSSGSANGSFNGPYGVCSEPSGFIYVADSGNNRVQKFSLDDPLPGWTINLFNVSGLVASQVTDANGSFRFSGLAPGNYTVGEVLQPGYFNTSAQSVDVSLGSNETLDVTASYGVFGNARLASVFGLKYLDVNANGAFDNNDTPLSGWTINLTNSSGLVGSVVTNASGFFLFANLMPGNYTLSEVVQPGYVNTSASTMNVTLGTRTGLECYTKLWLVREQRDGTRLGARLRNQPE